MDNDKQPQQVDQSTAQTEQTDAEALFEDAPVVASSADESVENPFDDSAPAEQVTPEQPDNPFGGQSEAEPEVAADESQPAAADEAIPAVEEATATLGVPGMDWYVVKIATGYEKFIETSLREQMAIEKMEDAFGDVLVPTEEVVEIRAGQKRKSRRKFFPGYMLIQMKRDEKAWHMIRNITHVLGFVGGRRDQLPVPLTPKEVADIANRIQTGEDKPRPKVLFEVGEVVRIIDGPFADFDGVVEEVNYEKSRLKISVRLFGRSTPVELEFAQVEKN